MDKVKLLRISVGALVVLNIATLTFLAIAPHHNRPMPREIIIDRLHFDASQQKEYDKLIAWHRKKIDSLERKMRFTKNNLYLQLLRNAPDDKLKDSLISEVSMYQKQIEETHFRHFSDIRALCHPDQMRDFYALTGDLAQLFSKPAPHRR